MDGNPMIFHKVIIEILKFNHFLHLNLKIDVHLHVLNGYKHLLKKVHLVDSIVIFIFVLEHLKIQLFQIISHSFSQSLFHIIYPIFIESV